MCVQVQGIGACKHLELRQREADNFYCTVDEFVAMPEQKSVSGCTGFGTRPSQDHFTIIYSLLIRDRSLYLDFCKAALRPCLLLSQNVTNGEACFRRCLQVLCTCAHVSLSA